MATGSVDAVTLRSVLIYISEKRACFDEFARVLRPGGRLSIFEPINRFGQAEWTGTRFSGIDVEPVAPLMDLVREAYRRNLPEDDPMLDFDERDLFRLAEQAGFYPVELSLMAEVRPARAASWDVFINSAGNPNVPTLAEAMNETLSPDERAELTTYLRPIVESGGATRRMAHAYLRAVRTSS
jgi:SAM-dependent methyltransferase